MSLVLIYCWLSDNILIALKNNKEKLLVAFKFLFCYYVIETKF
jgi:hypothetical protein